MIKDVLKRQTTIIAVTVIGICLCLMGVSYAIFFDIKRGSSQTVTSGTLTVQFAETRNSLITNGATDGSTEEPKTDEEGKASDGYQFSVTNNGTLPMKYNIYLYEDPSVPKEEGERVDHANIKVLLDDEGKDEDPIKTLSDFTCENMDPEKLGEDGEGPINVCKINSYELGVLAKGNEGATKTHIVRIWVTDNVTEGQIIALKLAVLGEAGEAKEPPKPKAFSEIIKVDNTNIFADEAENIRYAGPDAEVNNYIWFNCNDYDFTSAAEAASKNCEKWRIIGLFKNITKTEGGTEDLVKIIRAESVGTMAWDSNNSNNWTNASLKPLLEGYYNGTTLSSAKGITESTKPMIEQVTWNLGGPTTYNDVTAAQFYTAERGTTVSSGAQATWDGYIGLMYPSDYGYATAGESQTNRDACLAYKLYGWNSGTYKTDCAGNDWLYDSSKTQWTFTPSSSDPLYVFYVGITGSVNTDYGASFTYAVRPSLYLKSSVQIANGEGTSTEPYIPKMA